MFIKTLNDLHENPTKVIEHNHDDENANNNREGTYNKLVKYKETKKDFNKEKLAV